MQSRFGIKSLLTLALILFSTCLLADNAFACDYLKSFPESLGEGLRQPLSWQASDWFVASGIVLGIGAVYLADEEIRDFMQDNRSDASQSVMTTAKIFGEGKYLIPGMAVTIAGGYIAGSEKTMDTGLLSLKSFIISQSFTQTLKLATQRRRPSANAGKQFWSVGGFNRKHDSFPSGHSTLAWSLAPILAEQYQAQKWVAPTVYSIAALTSISRVHDNNHWASDALAGAVIGYFSAKLVLQSTPRLQLSPLPDAEGIGFLYRF